MTPSYCVTDLNQTSGLTEFLKDQIKSLLLYICISQTITIINTFQNDRKLQTLNKDQQILTAEQNQLLLDHGKLEQKAQVSYIVYKDKLLTLKNLL